MHEYSLGLWLYNTLGVSDNCYTTAIFVVDVRKEETK